MDAANTVFVDFSKIHLTKAEYKLLVEITNNPRRKIAQPAEAERLCELGLAEMYEAVGKETKTQSLFGTSLGSEYVEYYRREKRRRVLEVIKWIIPLLLSIIALVLAIRANTGGTRVRTNNGTSTSYTTTNNSNNNNANRNTTNTQTQQNNNNNASQEPNGNNNNNAMQQNANGGGSGEPQGNNQGNSQQQNNNAGGSGEPQGNNQGNGQQNTNGQASGEAGSASGGAS